MNHAASSFGGISQEELAAVRQLIGQPLQIEQWNHEASYDSIRHWCYGIGDDNPLWNDERYALQAPNGTMLAPPSFLFSVFGPSIRPGFPSLLSLQGGGRLEIDRYVKRGERLVAEAKLVDLVEKYSPKAGKMLIGIGETTYRTIQGERVGAYISRGIRLARPAQGGRKLYEPREHHHRYTEEELRSIEEEILRHERAGSRCRYWDDVEVGDRLPACVKGPLDFATMACFHAGLGPIGYACTDIAVKRRAEAHRSINNAPPDYKSAAKPQKSFASGDGHDDPETARSAGMPGAFDIGWQRISWMSQTLTDWMGDLGRLQVIDVRLISPNVIGDTLRCRGTVVGKRTVGGLHLVDIDVDAERQDREITASGTAIVALPARRDAALA